MKNFRLLLDTFWVSPYSFSAFVALKEKGIQFDLMEVALHKKEARSLEYRRFSMTGRIPAIQHGDFKLAESGAIIEYLEDVLPAPAYKSLLPQNIEERAKARMILHWLRSSRDLMPLIKERSAETIFYQRAEAPLSALGQQSAEKLIEFAEYLITETSDYLFSSWCIADSDLAFALQRLIRNNDPLPENLKRYAEAQWLRSTVREFVNRRRPEYIAY